MTRSPGKAERKRRRGVPRARWNGSSSDRPIEWWRSLEGGQAAALRTLVDYPGEWFWIDEVAGMELCIRGLARFRGTRGERQFTLKLGDTPRRGVSG